MKASIATAGNPGCGLRPPFRQAPSPLLVKYELVRSTEEDFAWPVPPSLSTQRTPNGD